MKKKKKKAVDTTDTASLTEEEVGLQDSIVTKLLGYKRAICGYFIYMKLEQKSCVLYQRVHKRRLNLFLFRIMLVITDLGEKRRENV